MRLIFKCAIVFIHDFDPINFLSIYSASRHSPTIALRGSIVTLDGINFKKYLCFLKSQIKIVQCVWGYSLLGIWWEPALNFQNWFKPPLPSMFYHELRLKYWTDFGHPQVFSFSDQPRISILGKTKLPFFLINRLPTIYKYLYHVLIFVMSASPVTIVRDFW